MLSRLRLSAGRCALGASVALTLGAAFVSVSMPAAGAAALHRANAPRVHNTAPVRPIVPRPKHVAVPAAGSGNLINHGGPVENAPRVFIVFWDWTTDPSGEQTYLTNFLSSIGGNSWLSTVAQYGGGWTGNLLAGTWSDTGSTIPSHPSDSQIQSEAARAASHFGAGTSDNVEIVVATAHNHNSSGFGTQYCAYHGTVSSDPNVTYTNLPYITDAGASCGENSVNGGSAGLLDGVSIVEGHEMAESITDPLLNAWFDSSGEEIGDKCAWINLTNITTSKGRFAVQPLWSNSARGCVG